MAPQKRIFLLHKLGLILKNMLQNSPNVWKKAPFYFLFHFPSRQIKVCLSRVPFWLNLEWHKGHSKGFSPVCPRICRSIFALWFIIFGQNGQAYDPGANFMGKLWKKKNIYINSWKMGQIESKIRFSKIMTIQES